MPTPVHQYLYPLKLKLDLVQLNDFVDVLWRFYLSSAVYQREQDRTMTLKFIEYVQMHAVKYLHVLARQFRMGRLHDFKESQKAMVLSWEPGAIRSGLPLAVGTAVICSRKQSIRNNWIQKGEKLTDKMKNKISLSMMGHVVTPTTVAKIAATNKQTYADKSDEEKAAINAKKSAAAAARWAAYRAAKANDAGKSPQA